jgi:DNA-directed RNA polymerase specialized sigma24 family protein
MSGSSWSDIPTDLQARITAGDPGVLNPLAEWLHSHRPRRVSDDVIQKTLGTLCRLMSSDQGRSLLTRTRSLAGFLAALATRHQGDERRAEKRMRNVVTELSRSATAKKGSVDPTAILARSEMREAIFASLAALRPIEREALMRAVMLDESYRSIAQSLFGADDTGRCEQRLRMLVHRARKKLQTRLKDLGSR